MEIRNYRDVQSYLELFIKPFSSIRLGSVEVTPLERMRFLLEKLGNPHHLFRSVVVTGTSGKGSTAYLLSNVLREAGYRVGLTVSPHLQKINERLQINNEPITDSELVQLIREMQPVIAAMSETHFGEPSYFEIIAAAGFLYFSRQSLDIAVIEVGMEGKYEASNLLSPLGVILTNISLDHTALLGETIEQIAGEAVHAINGHVSDGFVISGVTQSSVLKIVVRRSLEKHMRLFLLDNDFSFDLHTTTLSGCVFDFRFGTTSFSHLQLSLLGSYQASNASLVLAGICQLQSHGFSISESAIRRAFKTSSFSGRFEIIAYRFQTHPYTIILDGAHNEAKMSAFLHSLAKLYPQRKKIFVLAFKNDKFIEQMLQAVLSQASMIVVTEFHITTDMAKNTAYSRTEIAALLKALSTATVPVFVEPTSQDALVRALSLAKSDELIVTTGSLFLVGEIRQYLLPAPV